MDICVIIPARNEAARIAYQLDALLSQQWTGTWEILVVDNGSTDGTVELVTRYAERHPRLRLLAAAEKADQSYAANAGVNATDADAVLFCDADDIVADGWLAAMASALETHDVVTGPNELDQLNPGSLAETRGRGIETPLGSFFGIFPLIRGNNYGVRSAVWRRTGPLVEGFARNGVGADAEFSLRCWLNGIDIIGVPEAIVHYRYRSDGRSLWRQGLAYGQHRPQIARMLRDAGKPRPPRFGGWKSWLMLLMTIPSAVTSAGRTRWLWIAGNRFGQVVGSIKYRTLML